MKKYKHDVTFSYTQPKLNRRRKNEKIMTSLLSLKWKLSNHLVFLQGFKQNNSKVTNLNCYTSIAIPVNATQSSI